MKFSYTDGDVIAALATARVPAGVAVVRVSGPSGGDVDVRMLAEAFCPALGRAAPRTMAFGSLFAAGEEIDHGMAVFFPGPASFTGEDVVEFHVHGSLAVVDALLAGLTAVPGVRMALPGEFSRRAVHNGKMDLTQAEGIADLIAAHTLAQRRQALKLLDGELGRSFELWRVEILRILAQVEAAIDFPDEELDVLADEALVASIRRLLEALNRSVVERAGERIRDGVKLALVGRPNAGKSTLLNLLAGRDVAIVSDLAGTTRDVVTAVLDIGGFPVVLADTAGLRVAGEALEAEGIRRALLQAEQADVLIVVIGADEWPDVDPAVAELMVPGRTFVVVSKADLVEGDFPPVFELVDACDEREIYPMVAVNLQEGDSLSRILPVLEAVVRDVAGVSSDAALLTRERHRVAVRLALANLGQALVMMGKAGHGSGVAELVAEDLREAAAAIGSVTGRVSSEDVLDVVFSTFCIGK